MPRYARKTAQIFGSNAGANQLAVIGSAAAGAPAYSTDPAQIQSLAQYLSGWFATSMGYSPAIEDMNALCYLFAYQIAYGMQLGVSEWDAGTTYYKGSIAQDGTGNLYISLIDNNLNQALSTSSWRSSASNVSPVVTATTNVVNVAATDNGKTFLINTTGRSSTINLPAPVANFSIRIKDTGANANNNPITIHRYAAESFEGVASDYILMANGGSMLIVCDGTNWFKL